MYSIGLRPSVLLPRQAGQQSVGNGCVVDHILRVARREESWRGNAKRFSCRDTGGLLTPNNGSARPGGRERPSGARAAAADLPPLPVLWHVESLPECGCADAVHVLRGSALANRIARPSSCEGHAMQSIQYRGPVPWAEFSGTDGLDLPTFAPEQTK